MDKRDWGFLLMGIGVGIALISIFFIIQETNIPSKCYTTIQPPRYLIDYDYKLKDNQLIITYPEKNPLFFTTVVGTGSMRPIVSDDSVLLVIKNFTEEDIKVGDIISIKREEKKNLLHRVVEITEQGYITQGDNNPVIDKEIWNFSQIEKKVVGIFY